MAFVSTTSAFPRPTGKHELLYQQIEERIAVTVGALPAMLLSLSPIDGTLDLYKNGTRLDNPTQFTITDRTLSPAVAPVAGDIYVARYYFRATRTV